MINLIVLAAVAIAFFYILGKLGIFGIIKGIAYTVKGILIFFAILFIILLLLSKFSHSF